jgi:hypothetical protein
MQRRGQRPNARQIPSRHIEVLGCDPRCLPKAERRPYRPGLLRGK